VKAELCMHAGFLLGLFFDPEDGGDVPPKRRLTFNGLYGVISQKIGLFKKSPVLWEYNFHTVLQDPF
jgi:hypothetical protein